MMSSLRLLCAALGLMFSGCAAYYDLFQRDQSRPAALAEALRLPRPAVTDVALVLGCPALDDGTPSLCLRCRVHAALAAYRRGEVRAVLFSGGAAHNRFIEAAVMAREAERQGLPRSVILLESESLTTWQNLRLSRRIMEAHGLHTALLISTRDHLPRAPLRRLLPTSHRAARLRRHRPAKLIYMSQSQAAITKKDSHGLIMAEGFWLSTPVRLLSPGRKKCLWGGGWTSRV